MFRILTFLLVAAALSVAQAGQNVVVVLDDSGSMGDRMGSDRNLSRMECAKQALIGVLETLPADTKVGVLLLNGRGEKWIYPIGPIDSSKIRSTIGSVEPTGSTPLGSTMKEGMDALLELREQEKYGTYRLLIVTDGEAGDKHLVDQYLPDIMQRGMWVDAIGVDMDEDHSLATQVHSYRKGDDSAGLQEALATVLAETTDSGTADDSDYALIAPLPDEMVSEILTRLTVTANHGIGEQPRVEMLVDDDGQPVLDDKGNVQFKTEDPVEEGGFSGWWIIIGGVIIVIILIVVMVGGQNHNRADTPVRPR